MAFKLVIFDCDGVLVDSEKLANNVLANMLAGYGYHLSGEDAERRFRGMQLSKCLDILKRETSIKLPGSFETDLRQQMSEVFRSHLRPVEGALRLVESLQVNFCVASNGPTKKIEENLQTTNLLPYFVGNLFSAYEFNSWKPDPGLFLSAAKHFGVAPRDCIVVEDSLVGVNAGIAANMSVLALNSTEDNKPFTAAHRVFRNLDEIHAFLASKDLARK